jgi:hypothetical protein
MDLLFAQVFRVALNHYFKTDIPADYDRLECHEQGHPKEDGRIEWRRGDLNPSPENHNHLSNKELTENPKNNTAQNLPKTGNYDMKSITENYPDLEQIITAWPELPEHVKAAIKTLIQTKGK